MFYQARIKLTAWYLLIIMLISASFSVAIYEVLNSELNRVERMQRVRIEGRFPLPGVMRQFGNQLEPENFYLDQDILVETRNRLKIILLVINVVIISSSAVAGYFLAGKTLKPIAEMLEKQKEFVSNASHEIKTPLTSLKTETEVALRDKKITLEEAKNVLNSNLEEVNKMQKLTGYLLTLNKFQDITLTFNQVNLKNIVQEAVKKTTKLAKIKKIKIVFKLENSKINGNKESLIELTTILLDNAIKYSQKKKEIIVKTQKDGIMEIADQGVGIKKEDLPHIFERFYRADTSRNKENNDGYGLGLSIAKQIVDLHKGKIEVESKFQKGTTFRVIFS